MAQTLLVLPGRSKSSSYSSKREEIKDSYRIFVRQKAEYGNSTLNGHLILEVFGRQP